MANIADIATKHQIYLQRVSATLENVSADIVFANDRKILSQLRKRLDKIGTFEVNRAGAAKLSKIQSEVLEIRKQALNLSKNNLIDDAKALAENEVAFSGRLLSEAVGKGVSISTLPAQQLNNVVNYGLFSGNTISQWYKRLEDADINRIMATVRDGISQGETTDQIIRTLSGTARNNYLDGVMNISRDSAKKIARTVTNGVANSAKSALYERNSDIIYAIVYSATLDSRTSAICRSLDGKHWRIPEEEDQIQTPPLHINCRSHLVPAVDKESINSPRPAERENFEARAEDRYNEKQQEKGNQRRFNDLSAETRRRYTLKEQKIYKSETGKNPFFETKNNYEDFFKRQSAEFQKDVLGPTRYKLYKQGGLSLDKFTDFNNKRQFTIAELRTKDKESFSKAGLLN